MLRLRSLLHLWLPLAATAPIAVASTYGPLAESVAQGPTAVEVRPLRGEAVRGELRTLDSKSIGVDVVGSGSTTFSLSELLSIQFPHGEAKSPDAKSEGAGGRVRVELPMGDSLSGLWRSGSAESLELALEGAPLAIPIESVRKVIFTDRLPKSLTDLSTQPGKDRLFRLRKGAAGAETVVEPIQGTLLAFSAAGVEFESVLGKTTFPFAEIVALSLAPLGEDKPAAPFEADAVLALAPEGRIRAKLLGVGGGALRVSTAAIPEIAIPLRALQAIRLRNQQFVDLSDLEPTEALDQPYLGSSFGSRRPWRRDRNVADKPLRVGGVEFATGIGVHSRSKLTYALTEPFVGLRARVGVDDETLQFLRKGSVIFRVLGDDKVLWESPVLRTGEPAVALPDISLKDVRKLTLEVDYADGMDIADYADWCEPLLLRARATGAEK